MKGRTRYVCKACGLTVEGKINDRGEVVPYDRAPWDGLTAPFLCAQCRQQEGK